MNALATPPATRELEANQVSPAAVILMYHRIGDPTRDRTNLCVGPLEFDGQLRVLVEGGYRVCTLAELASALSQGNAQERSVAITFDDGYVDNLVHAAPLLRKYSLPATFFVVSETLDAPGEFWWDTLARIFDNPHLPTALSLDLGDRLLVLPTSTPEERNVTFEEVQRGFMRCPTIIDAHASMRCCAGVVAQACQRSGRLVR